MVPQNQHYWITMAYGKIKADAVIWDNSGTDVEESMSNIAGKLNAAGGAMTVTLPSPKMNYEVDLTAAILLHLKHLQQLDLMSL